MKAHIFSFQLGKMANRVGYNPDDKVTFWGFNVFYLYKNNLSQILITRLVQL